MAFSHWLTQWKKHKFTKQRLPRNTKTSNWHSLMSMLISRWKTTFVCFTSLVWLAFFYKFWNLIWIMELSNWHPLMSTMYISRWKTTFVCFTSSVWFGFFLQVLKSDLEYGIVKLTPTNVYYVCTYISRWKTTFVCFTSSVWFGFFLQVLKSDLACLRGRNVWYWNIRQKTPVSTKLTIDLHNEVKKILLSNSVKFKFSDKATKFEENHLIFLDATI